MPRLLRWNCRNSAPSGAPPPAGSTNGPIVRSQSPEGGSSFTTSAPRSPSCIAQSAPEMPCETSTTRRPSSGSCECARPSAALTLAPFASPAASISANTSAVCSPRRGAARVMSASVVPKRQCGFALAMSP